MNGEKIQDMDSVSQDRPWIDVQRLEHKALQLFMIKEITADEYRALLKQLWSPDYENHVVADEIINNKIKSM